MPTLPAEAGDNADESAGSNANESLELIEVVEPSDSDEPSESDELIESTELAESVVTTEPDESSESFELAKPSELLPKVGKAPKLLSRRQQIILARKLKELEAIERELQRRKNLVNPMCYGLPDLLFPRGYAQGSFNPETGDVDRPSLPEEESEEDYCARQNEAIRALIEQYLHFTKDGRRVTITLVDKQVSFIADFFFGRVKRGILWKGRGCLTPENLVLTDVGLRTMSSLTKGDMVMNHTGRMTEILDAVSRGYKGKIVRIRISGNDQSLGFTPDHLILAVRASQSIEESEQWVEAGSLQKGDLVFVPVPVAESAHRSENISETTGWQSASPENEGGVPLSSLVGATDLQLECMLADILRDNGYWDGTSVRVSWRSSLVAANFMYACWRLGFTPAYWISNRNGIGLPVDQQFCFRVSGKLGCRLARIAWGVDPPVPTFCQTDRHSQWRSKGKIFSMVKDVVVEDYCGDVYDIEVADGSSFCLPYVTAHNCGGSLCAAILIWLRMIYQQMSFIDLGGSMEQSRVVYEYVSAFWDAVPGMRQDLLSKDPLISMTKLITGVQLKCIVPGTLVLTDRGILPIESVGVGDRIIDGNGRLSRVSMTIRRQYRGDVVRLLSAGSSREILTTSDHKIWAARVSKPVGKCCVTNSETDGLLQARWIEAEDLEPGDLLPVPKLATDPVPKTLVLENLRARCRGPKPLISLPVNPEFYRLLGYIIASGSSHGRWVNISFGKHALEEAADCQALVSSVLGRKACRLSQSDRLVDVVHFSFKAFAAWLRANCGKRQNKRIPLWLLQQASDVELREFLIGILGGKAGFGRLRRTAGSRSCMTFSSTSSQLIQAIMLVCQRLGFTGQLHAPVPRWRYDRKRRYRGKQRYLWQVTGCVSGVSESGASGYADNSHVYNKIDSLEFGYYDGPVIDLVVDGHPSFTLPGALVHNCIPASEKMARGKHLPGLVADEASIVPGTPIWTRNGVRPIEEVCPGDLVLTQDGAWRSVERRLAHPYSGRILQLNGYGDGVGAWVTEEHRVFGVVDTKQAADGAAFKKRGLKAADWHRAWSYDVGDVLVYPRLTQRGHLPHLLHDDPVRWRLLGYWCGARLRLEAGLAGPLVVFSLDSSKPLVAHDAADCVKQVFGEAPAWREPLGENRIELAARYTEEWRDIVSVVVSSENACIIPMEWLEAASSPDLRNLLLGLFRTGGKPILWSDSLLSKWTWAGCSPQLAMTIMYATNRLGIPVQVEYFGDDRGSVGDAWEISVRWDYALHVLERADTDGIELPVRVTDSKQWCDDANWYSAITSIDEKHYDGPVYDLQVRDNPSFGCPQRLMLHNCQDDQNADITFKAAMQMSMSEPDHMILLLSTFHHPVGLFQEIWDNAEAKGFRRYNWNVFDVMQKCDVGMESASSEDPVAAQFCRNSCPLTSREAVYDTDNKLLGYRYEGCDGRARSTNGFLPRENVINALVLNEGSEIFRIEYMCVRPQFSGPIYGLEAIENTLVSEIEIVDTDRTIVGIDWGVKEGALIIGKDSELAGPQILESTFLSVKLVSEYIRVLSDWQDEYGELDIYADSSHPFQIGDLEEAGFKVTPVDFATMKEYGITNLLKMFMYDKIRILNDNTHLIDQLKSYRKDPKTGRPIKINDHGPDALLCMTITIDFTERWADLITARAHGIARTRLIKTLGELGIQSDPKVEENSIDRDNGVMLF